MIDTGYGEDFRTLALALIDSICISETSNEIKTHFDQAFEVCESRAV